MDFDIVVRRGIFVSLRSTPLLLCTGRIAVIPLVIYCGHNFSRMQKSPASRLDSIPGLRIYF